MNDEEREKSGPSDSDDSTDPSSGINLTLIYSLIALALVAAIVIATFIVLPFYHRR